jgi:hypothetical protein
MKAKLEVALVALRQVLFSDCPGCAIYTLGSVLHQQPKLVSNEQWRKWGASICYITYMLILGIAASCRSCSVIPGGIAEMFMLDDHKERIYLRKRFGFIKVALEVGADLVPIYHFGASRVLRISRSRIMQTISRTLKVSLILFYGRAYLPIPRRHPVLTVIGAPIAVQKVANPTREQVGLDTSNLPVHVFMLNFDVSLFFTLRRLPSCTQSLWLLCRRCTMRIGGSLGGKTDP